MVTRDDLIEIEKLKSYLATKFEIKDLGGLRSFLGIEVARSEQSIFISQQTYVLDLLKETGLLECKPEETPIDVNHKLRDITEETMREWWGSSFVSQTPNLTLHMRLVLWVNSCILH